MKLNPIAAALVLGTALISCNEVEQPKTQPRAKFLESLQQQTFQTSSNLPNQGAAAEMGAPRMMAGGAPGAGGPRTAPPAIGRRPAAAASAAPPVEQIPFPKDARWSLYCMSIAGPERFHLAAQM